MCRELLTVRRNKKFPCVLRLKNSINCIRLGDKRQLTARELHVANT